MVTIRKIILPFTFKLWQLIYYIWRMYLHFQSTHLNKMINSKNPSFSKTNVILGCVSDLFLLLIYICFWCFDSYRTCQTIKDRCRRHTSVVKCTFALIEDAGLVYSIHKVMLPRTSSRVPDPSFWPLWTPGMQWSTCIHEDV